MISQVIWKKQLSNSDSLYSICINEVYSEIFVACQNEIIFIKLETGEIISKKRYHRSIIYSIEISFDGSYFASSSADGMIIIWHTKDHESLLSFGSSLSVRSLHWSPTGTVLLTLSLHEYYIWQPMQTRANCHQIKDLSITIENGAFSTDGLTYALSFSDGTIKIYQLEKQEEILTFSFSSPLTIFKFKQINDEEFLVTVDIDRYVSIYKISDKSLIRKNKLSFEALQITELNINDSCFFLFSGVSNKISIFTENLMFLDNIQTNEKWIWDIQIDKNNNLFLCGRSGYVEMRKLKIHLISSSYSNCIVFIENLNRFRLKDIKNDQKSFSLEFPMIIQSLSISSYHLMVMFKSCLYIYLYNFQDQIENNDDLYRKMFEIPGNFECAKSDISDRNIFVGIDKKLSVYSMNGILKTNFSFNSKINSILKTEAINDGCIIGCENGSIFFYIVDQPEPVLLYKHKKAIKYAKKWNLTIAFIDKDKELLVLNSFTNEILTHEKNIETFAFSDRIENLFVFNDCNGNIYTYFLHHKSKPFFIEGNIISFVGNKVVLINGNLIDYLIPELPFEKILHESKLHQDSINQFYELININPNYEQWKLIYNVAHEINIPDIELLAAQHIAENNIPKQKVNEKKNPDEYEKLGAINAAVHGYVEKNDWKNVFRLINSNGLERLLLELNIPERELENAARYLLKSELYEGAIQLLKKSKNTSLLANIYVLLGRWLDAITLSLSNPSIYHIVFPKFAEQLFYHQNYFESIICFFILSISFSAEDRSSIFSKLYNNVAQQKNSFIQKSFISLLQGFNEPNNYWILHLKSVAFYASNRLSEFLLLPLSEDDATTVFYLSYFVIAFLHRFQMSGISYIDILTQFLLSSSILGLKKWVDYSLKEFSMLSITEPISQIITKAKMEIKNDIHKIHFQCKKCKKDLFESSNAPLLYCGSCGSSIAFSVHSCKPIPITEICIADQKNESKKTVKIEDDDGKYVGLNKAIEILNSKNCIDEEMNFDADEFISKEGVDVDELCKLPPILCVIQKLKKTSNVKPRLWFNEDIEYVHCCCNCGSFYNETDYQDSVIESHQCIICHSPFVDEQIEEEESALLNLLRPFEEDSPVSF